MFKKIRDMFAKLDKLGITDDYLNEELFMGSEDFLKLYGIKI